MSKAPRAKITPSWVREKVQSSMSAGSGSEEENASTSEEEQLLKKDAESVTNQTRRPKSKKRAHGPASSNMHRFTVGAKSRITDTGKCGFHVMNGMQ